VIFLPEEWGLLVASGSGIVIWILYKPRSDVRSCLSSRLVCPWRKLIIGVHNIVEHSIDPHTVEVQLTGTCGKRANNDTGVCLGSPVRLRARL
jgi:hypothetical protein